MRLASTTARPARLLPLAMVLAIACGETTPPAVPTTLAFTVQPSSGIAARVISPAITVAVVDANGSTLASATNSITITIASNPSNGVLSGTTTLTATNGVARFADLTIDKPGNYVLSASSPTLTSANTTLSIVNAPAEKLAFTVQPVTTIARTTIPAFTVAVQDAGGNIATTSTVNVVLRLGVNPTNAFLNGTISRNAVNGVVTFADISVSAPGSGYSIIASAPVGTGIVAATSVAFNQTIGSAAKMVFAVQPVATAPAAVIPPVSVLVQDAAGNTVTTATSSIAVAIGTNPAGGTLSGISTAVPVNGGAVFSNLSINNSGSGYTLTATSSDLPVATSIGFSIRNPLSFASVTAGYFHSCGLAISGDAYCWGANSVGQLGAPATAEVRAPEAVSSGIPFARIGAGRTHTCGLTPSGVAYCWGSNDDGNLGTGGLATSVPTLVSGGLTFGAVIAGYSHSCGVTASGAAYCWGDNATGALGDGTQTRRTVPAAVSGGLGFAAVSPGRDFTCGVTLSGVGYCWGQNSAGELGDGSTTSRTIPVQVSGQHNFATIGAGGFHSCGLTTAGKAYCWGSNASGQVGDGTTIDRFAPVPVSTELTFAVLSVGNRHTCAVTTTGHAYCWGENAEGKLGLGTTTPSAGTPTAVAGGLTFAGISAGRFHTCGVTTSGAAYCWGANFQGLLGDGTSETRLAPVPVR